MSLIERIDVGLVPPPRERKVTVHAMHKRQRRKKAAMAVVSSRKSNLAITEVPEPASDCDSTRANQTSNASSVLFEESSLARLDDSHSPQSLIQSDRQSEVSGGSVTSRNSSNVRSADGGGPASGGPIEDREITATVELLKGGCLPGDLLPVRIRVDHNRRMKSMHGVIVTLHRQGRVDYAPPASLFTNLSKEEARKLEHEEMYPKSRTGLGGLSLSAAGSCSVFRKDLSQTVTPLIIDPTTLSANIATSVRVPEDAFPSIKDVPGGLIAFKYYVEVIVDLGGKLDGPSQGSPKQSGRTGPLSMSGAGAAPGVGPHDTQLSRLANWNGTIVDTDHLRREKGVISVSFEVIVGNVDTIRSTSKPVVRPALPVQPPSDQAQVNETPETNYEGHDGYEDTEAYDEGGSPWTPYDLSQTYFPPGSSTEAPQYGYDAHIPQAPVYVPPPQPPDHSGLSDKERVREAEQRLFPSRPSVLPQESVAGPSRVTPPSRSNVQSPTLEAPVGESSGAEEPSAPTLAELSDAAHANHTDDKQEMERRRLLAEASAPPEMPEDSAIGGPLAPPLDFAVLSTSHEPSAPALHEQQQAEGCHESYGGMSGPSTARGPHGHDPRVEFLPKYER